MTKKWFCMPLVWAWVQRSPGTVFAHLEKGYGVKRCKSPNFKKSIITQARIQNNWNNFNTPLYLLKWILSHLFLARFHKVGLAALTLRSHIHGSSPRPCRYSRTQSAWSVPYRPGVHSLLVIHQLRRGEREIPCATPLPPPPPRCLFSTCTYVRTLPPSYSTVRCIDANHPF